MWQSVLRDMKMAKSPKHNLTFNQQKALKELKADEEIDTFPYDKGAGLVRITIKELFNLRKCIKKLDEVQVSFDVVNLYPLSTHQRNN